MMRAAVERQCFRLLRIGEGDQTSGPGGDDAKAGDAVDARGRDARRSRRQTIQLWKRRRDRITERLDEPAGNRRRGAHRDLLAEDRAQAHLEAIEGAGDANAGISLHGCREPRIPGEMPGDQVRAGVEIEQPADAGE